MLRQVGSPRSDNDGNDIYWFVDDLFDLVLWENLETKNIFSFEITHKEWQVVLRFIENKHLLLYRVHDDGENPLKNASPLLDGIIEDEDLKKKLIYLFCQHIDDSIPKRVLALFRDNGIPC